VTIHVKAVGKSLDERLECGAHFDEPLIAFNARRFWFFPDHESLGGSVLGQIAQQLSSKDQDAPPEAHGLKPTSSDFEANKLWRDVAAERAHHSVNIQRDRFIY
jgi:hypothetical protein